MTPATCGAALLVPYIDAVPPPSRVETMHVPGAASVCSSCAAVTA
jgi:hypothetical protein